MLRCRGVEERDIVRRRSRERLQDDGEDQPKKNFSRELGYSKIDGFSRSGRGVPVLFGAVAGLYFFFEIEQSPNNSKVILSILLRTTSTKKQSDKFPSQGQHNGTLILLSPSR